MGQVCLEVYLHCPKNVSRTLLELFYPVHVIDKMSTVIFFCRALPIIQSISNIKQWHFFCTFKSTFVISESFKTNKGNFCYNKIIFVLPFEALAGVCSRGQVTWLRSLLDWICQSKWDQICPSRGFACWAVCNESFWSLQIKEQSYMYIPSTLNIDLILWHTQLIVCAENVKSWFRSWVFPFTFQAYILPHTLNCMCVSLFKFHIWILEQF